MNAAQLSNSTAPRTSCRCAQFGLLAILTASGVFLPLDRLHAAGQTNEKPSEKVVVTVELCRYVRGDWLVESDVRKHVEKLLKDDSVEPDVRTELGKYEVTGFIFMVVAPKKYSGKLLTIHHDGVIASGDPTEFAQRGRRYEVQVPSSLLDDCHFRPCSCGFFLKPIKQDKGARGCP